MGEVTLKNDPETATQRQGTRRAPTVWGFRVSGFEFIVYGLGFRVVGLDPCEGTAENGGQCVYVENARNLFPGPCSKAVLVGGYTWRRPLFLPTRPDTMCQAVQR